MPRTKAYMWKARLDCRFAAEPPLPACVAEDQLKKARACLSDAISPRSFMGDDIHLPVDAKNLPRSF